MEPGCPPAAFPLLAARGSPRRQRPPALPGARLAPSPARALCPGSSCCLPISSQAGRPPGNRSPTRSCPFSRPRRGEPPSPSPPQARTQAGPRAARSPRQAGCPPEPPPPWGRAALCVSPHCGDRSSPFAVRGAARGEGARGPSLPFRKVSLRFGASTRCVRFRLPSHVDQRGLGGTFQLAASPRGTPHPGWGGW